VDTFLLDKHPVTNRDYAAFLANTGYPPSEVRSEFQISGEGANEAGLEALASLLADSARRGFTAALATTKPDHPVVEISWFDAVEFCRWAHMRLPTADQWEKAARGPKCARLVLWELTGSFEVQCQGNQS
jgi:formylglycine-generating enzyme required for sulfatase activity